MKAREFGTATAAARVENGKVVVVDVPDSWGRSINDPVFLAAIERAYNKEFGAVDGGENDTQRQ